MQAPRGDILDRNGKVLVANRTELAVQVQPAGPARRPAPTRSRELHLLSTVTGMTHGGDPQDAAERSSGGARRPGDPEEGARGRQGLLPAREPVELPGRERRAGLHPRIQAGHHRRPPLRQRRRGHRASSSRSRATPGSIRATRSANPGSSTSTTASCAAGRAPTASRSTRSAGRPSSCAARRPSPATTSG